MTAELTAITVATVTGAATAQAGAQLGAGNTLTLPIALVTAIAAGLISYGAVRTRIGNVEERRREDRHWSEQQFAKLEDKIDEMPERLGDHIRVAVLDALQQRRSGDR